jgi:glycosyltransferase involved in cell wall biosynthesis
VLEALAMGLPVFTSPLVANGLTAVDKLPIEVETDPWEFAQHVTEYLNGPERSVGQIEGTREILKKHYSWESNLSQFEALLDGTTSHSSYSGTSELVHTI